MTSRESYWSPPSLPSPCPHAGAIAGVILAGGASTRMGGRPKATLPWPPDAPTTTFLGSIRQAFDAAGILPVAVVTGLHHEQITVAAEPGPEVAWLFNPRHAEGQLTSMWRALDWAETLDPQPRWLAVALVDVPGVAADTLRRLCVAAAEVEADPAARSPVVVRPVIGQRHGHPVLWHRSAWPLLRACPVQLGARSAVRALAAQGRVLDIAVDDAAVLRDVDTDADYRSLR